MPRHSGALCQFPSPHSVRARAWSKMRSYRKSRDFTLDDLSAAIDAGERSNLRKYLSALVKAGILVVTDTKNGHPHVYRRACDVGPVSPVLRADGSGITDPNRREAITRSDPNSLRAKAWRAMRVFGQRRVAFTVIDIATRVFDAEWRLESLRIYIRALVRSGHLRKLTEGRYRLVSDTGPHSPILRRSAAIFDPNTGIEYVAEVRP